MFVNQVAAFGEGVSLDAKFLSRCTKVQINFVHEPFNLNFL